jgi:hypothetical protein
MCAKYVIGSGGASASLTATSQQGEERHVLARYLKAQLIVLLCGGLVGPIFLVIYYTSGFSDLLQWMLYVGLLITVADVVIAIALAGYSAKSAAKMQALEQNGVLGSPRSRDWPKRGHASTTDRWSSWTCASWGPGSISPAKSG